MQHITPPPKNKHDSDVLNSLQDVNHSRTISSENIYSSKHTPKKKNKLEKNIWKYQNFKLRIIAYLSLSIAFFFTLEVFVNLLDFNEFNYLTTHIRRVADALILALPIWFVRRNWILFLWIFLFEFYLNANLIYYLYYDELIPFSSFRLIDNLDGLGDSIIQGIGLGNIALLILPLFWCLWYGLRKISKRIKCEERKLIKIENIASAVFLLIATGIILPSYIVHNKRDYANPIMLFSFEPIRAFKQYGLINYWIYQLANVKDVSSDEERLCRQEVKALQKNWKQLQPLTSSSSKNLIIILVESLGSWPIGLEVNGENVTPRLDEIIGNNSTIYINKVLPQVKHGRSSDAQLMINTGLLPIANGATSSLYAYNDYPSLAKVLKQQGYVSTLYLCDNKKYWNQGATAKAYGIDRVYDQLGERRGVLSDEALFRNSIKHIRKQRQPFYTMLVTMSGHDPIRGDLKSKFHSMDFATEEARNITAIVNYTDSCIGFFIDDLKAAGLYDNSIIVITGDHDGVGRNKYEGREKEVLEDRFIPFIIINAPKGLRADENAIIGQSDIYSSLLDVMGISDYSWRGVGESIFRPRENGAIYRDLSCCGSMTPETAERRRKAWKLSDILIRLGWFGDE